MKYSIVDNQMYERKEPLWKAIVGMVMIVGAGYVFFQILAIIK